MYVVPLVNFDVKQVSFKYVVFYHKLRREAGKFCCIKNVLVEVNVQK